VRPDIDRPPPSSRAELTAPPGVPFVRLGLRRVPIGAGGALDIEKPFRDPLLLLPGETLGARGLARIARLASATDLFDSILATRVREWGHRPPDSLAFLPPVAPPTGKVATVLRPRRPPARAGEPGAAEVGVPGFFSDYADLALKVRSRAELGGDWTRFRPCNDQFQVSCNPGLIPQLNPELRFSVQVAGTIADRIHVDVDFDQSREFDAANRINISYVGREDDILKRLDVGDVSFRLPASRFLTRGIPAGNFGFQAQGQLGPLDFQAVWAQQRGDLNSREFTLSGVGDQRTFVQADTLVLDDADYVRGQFFFLVDPRFIDRYPDIDVLGLDAASAPPEVAPGPEPIQLYRFVSDPVERQQVQGFIQADAIAEKGARQVVESGWFRYLQPGLDYFVHASGLWVALRTPLSRDEMLAVTYVTATGDTVGDYNP